MASTYRSVRADTAKRMDDSEDPAKELIPCRYCGEKATRETLSMNGARCAACYDAFCRLPMPDFNARFKRNEPKLALPRKPIHVNQGHIGELLAKKSTPDQVRGYAEDLGIDVGDAA